MKIFSLPENPKKNHPERKTDVKYRLAIFLGGSALACLSLKVAIPASELSTDEELFNTTAAISSLVASIPVVTELMERFSHQGPGRNKVKLRPESPEPEGPSGILFVPDWTQEVQDYVDEESLTSV